MDPRAEIKSDASLRQFCLHSKKDWKEKQEKAEMMPVPRDYQQVEFDSSMYLVSPVAKDHVSSVVWS